MKRLPWIACCALIAAGCAAPEEPRGPPRGVSDPRRRAGAQGEATVSETDFFADPIYEELGWEDAPWTGAEDQTEGSSRADAVDSE